MVSLFEGSTSSELDSVGDCVMSIGDVAVGSEVKVVVDESTVSLAGFAVEEIEVGEIVVGASDGACVTGVVLLESDSTEAAVIFSVASGGVVADVGTAVFACVGAAVGAAVDAMAVGAMVVAAVVGTVVGAVVAVVTCAVGVDVIVVGASVSAVDSLLARGSEVTGCSVASVESPLPGSSVEVSFRLTVAELTMLEAGSDSVVASVTTFSEYMVWLNAGGMPLEDSSSATFDPSLDIADVLAGPPSWSGTNG